MLIVVIGLRVIGQRAGGKLVIQSESSGTCTIIASELDVIVAYAHVAGFECDGIRFGTRTRKEIPRKMASVINVTVLVAINDAIIGIEVHTLGKALELNLSLLGNGNFVPYLAVVAPERAGLGRSAVD